MLRAYPHRDTAAQATMNKPLVVSAHALPEPTGVFLRLGAWLVLARRREYRELLAASVLSFTATVPILMMATIVEKWVSPLVIDRFT